MMRNDNNKNGGPSGMVLSELKMLKERNRVLEAQLKKAESAVKASNEPQVTTAEHMKVHRALLNLLVAVENRFGGKERMPGEMKKAVDVAAGIIRPGSGTVVKPTEGLVEVAPGVVTTVAPVAEPERATLVVFPEPVKHERKLLIEDV